MFLYLGLWFNLQLVVVYLWYIISVNCNKEAVLFSQQSAYKMKWLSKDKQNGAIDPYHEPLEGVLPSVISAAPYAQLPVTISFFLFLFFIWLFIIYLEDRTAISL